MSESEQVTIEAAVACMGLRRGQRVTVEKTPQIAGALDGGKVFLVAPEGGEAAGEPVPPVSGSETGGPAEPPPVPAAPASKAKGADRKDQADA